jgi:hypothetical protein
VSTYTSRSRFDEARRFSGVFQQMGRVVLDSDWNEDVRIRVSDARRRSGDVVDGSPDEGFLIASAYALDAIVSPADFIGTGMPAGDSRVVPEVRLVRKEPASLPLVLRTHGNINLLRSFTAPIDLRAIARPEGGGTYAAGALLLAVRFEVPSNEQELTDARLLLSGPSGQVAVPLAVDPLPSAWTVVRIPLAALATLDRVQGGRTTTVITGWGLTGLPPRALTFVDALRAEPSDMDRTDFVIRGGDGTLAGAGRIFASGVRATLAADHRYASQPDYPEPVALAELAGATPPPAGGHFFVYLDLFEQPVTVLDDPFLSEPALDGADTTTRLRLVEQVRARWVAAGARDALPTAVGGGTLTTAFADSDATPLRYPLDRVDPSRGLFTESMATQKGYRGSENLHVRVEVFGGPSGRRAALWSRDNAATVAPLVLDAPARATTLYVSPEDALKLSAGDVIVLEDRVTRLQPEGPKRRPALRQVAAVDAATGAVTLAFAQAPARSGGAREALDDGSLGTAPTVDAGAPFALKVADRASLRKWDGADWLAIGQRYNLPDGIDFAFGGDVASTRPGDYWSFTARVHDPDGRSHGVVEPLVAAAPHGPTHVYAPLARISETAGVRSFEDLRARYLPLAHVRDRLRELEQPQKNKGPFAIVVGDGVTTFGDIDQNVVEGVTADEAIQTALKRLEGSGGTLYIRAGNYVLERPVLVDTMSRVRIVGDGDATRIEAAGAGGAFVVYGSGGRGEVAFEHLAIHEKPFATVTIGAGAIVRPDDDPLLEVTDLVASASTASKTLAARLAELTPAKGRTFAAVLASLRQIKLLQQQNQGKTLDQIPKAFELAHAVIAKLPHGVITVADSAFVTIHDCLLESDEPKARGAGVLITGTCERIAITRSRVRAAAGIVAMPFSPLFNDAFLTLNPAAALTLEDLRVEDNDLVATGDKVYGVHLVDGELDGIRIANNRVSGFAIGVEVGDSVELRGQGAKSGIVVEDNRVLDATVIGILVAGDGVDVVNNEVTNAGDADLFLTSGLLHAAIQVVGQGVRVRGSWIRLPAVRSAPALGVYAGIVVGEGLDDGASTARAIFDVEVEGNRIEGAGAQSLAAGVILGGPHPVFDVRVRGNVMRALGDAAVRVLGTGVATARLRIEGNRIEDVSLASPSSGDGFLKDEIDALALGLSTTLGPAALAGPQALLSALVARADSGSIARGPLDGALRWVERLTLRGGIVASGVEDAQIVDNRVLGVGSFDVPTLPADLAAQVRTAAIAVVGGQGVNVANNQIEDVRTPIRVGVFGAAASGDELRLDQAISALDNIAANLSTPAGQDPELHATAVALHVMLHAAAVSPSTFNAAAQTSLFAGLDATNAALISLGDAAFAQSFAAQVARLRATPTATDALAMLRLHAAHIARVTADTDATTAAWAALEALEDALISNVAADITAAVAQAKAALGALSTARQTQITAALDALANNPLGAIDAMAQVAVLTDENDRSSDTPAGSVYGDRVGIIASLTQKLRSAQLAPGPNSQLDPLRSDVSGLVQLLRESGADVARYVLADFTTLDAPTLAGANIEIFRATLGRVADWVTGAPAEASSGALEDAALRLGRARGDASLRLLVIDDLDQRAAQIDDLADVSTALADASLDSVIAGAGQLATLVTNETRFALLAHDVATALTDAKAKSGAARTTALQQARTKLNDLRLLVGEVAASTSGDSSAASSSEISARRLAGLGALVLALTAEPKAEALVRKKATTLLTTLLPRAAQETDGGTALSRTAAKLATTADSEALSDALLSQLATLLDAIGIDVAGKLDTPTMLAVSSLLRAVSLSYGAGGVQAAQSFLAARKQTVSAAIVDRVVALNAADLATRLAQVRDALGESLVRLAVGEHRVRKVLVAPQIATVLAPSDGVFAAAVGEQIRIAANTIETSPHGVTITGAGGHVVADPGDGPDSQIDVSGNQIRGCAYHALNVASGAASVVRASSNQVSACADLAEDTPNGQAVARFTGRGTLVLDGNVFQGNGHGHPNALLHEVVIDWRGEIVVRANTIHHHGGGAGGAGLLLVLEDLDRSVDIVKLATIAALSVEPPPPVNPTGVLPVRPPWRGDGLFKPLFLPIAPAATHYLIRKDHGPQLRAVDFLRPRPRPRIPLPPPVPAGTPAERSLLIEGNHVQAAGPALLALAMGNDIITTTISGNALQSLGDAGAVYVRHTDATVFSANQCACRGAINVVVMRFDAAPVTISGNIIVGQQPVAQTDPGVLARRDDLKRVAGLEIAKQAGVLSDLIAAGIAKAPSNAETTQAASSASSSVINRGVKRIFNPKLGQKLVDLKEAQIVTKRAQLTTGFASVRAKPVTEMLMFRAFDAAPAAADVAPAATTAAPPPTTAPVASKLVVSPALLRMINPQTAPPAPEPRSSSLVVLGGTRVLSTGNATSAGVYTQGADAQTNQDL